MMVWRMLKVRTNEKRMVKSGRRRGRVVMGGKMER